MTPPARPDPSDPSASPGLAGPLLFTRYAYPPNELGYCGPGDSQELFDYGVAQVSDPGLVEIASRFHGPWPYLKLIAGAAGIDDPFDRRVVEAYWVGNELLDRVEMADFGNRLRETFHPRAGRHWEHLAQGIPAGGVAHHSFHVFGVYPWVGLLTSGRSDDPLHQLDRCRIRWGQVVALEGDQAVVRFRPLAWDGTRLSLGPEDTESVQRAHDGRAFVHDLAPGDWVSMHWHWICDRLDARQLRNLEHYHQRQLVITNDRVSHSGPGVVIAGG